MTSTPRFLIGIAIVCVMAVILTMNLLDSRAPSSPPQQPPKASATGAAGGPANARSATIAVVTKQLENARALLEDLCHRRQGHIARLSLANEGSGPHTLIATLRVPAEQVEAAMVELRHLGRVAQESQSRDEISQQYSDLVARLNNARSTESSLIDVQHQRTGKVEETLEVQKEVARAREEIGRLEAQRQSLDNQIAVASIDVYVREEQNKAVETPQASPGSRLWSAIGDGCQEAVEQVVGTLAFLFRCLPSIVLWIAVLFWPLKFAWQRWRPALRVS
jgi:hypothetical protein